MLQRTGNERGTTLIEMTIIAVLIGILAAMAVPRWLAYMPQLRTKTAAREAVSRLRDARSKSISEKVPYGVHFNVTTGELVLFANTNQPGTPSYTTGDSVITSAPVGADVNIGLTTFTNSSVVFDANGAASETGQVVINSADYITSFTVDVLAATGRVRMVQQDQGSTPPI